MLVLLKSTQSTDKMVVLPRSTQRTDQCAHKKKENKCVKFIKF